MTFLLNFLGGLNIDINDMRGQGYDNGANMKGKKIGLQKKILDINPRAFYVPCAAHSLNLVVNDAAKCYLEVTNFFAIVQELYVFFSASTSRWQVLKKELPTLTLKSLSDTRWESRIDAVKALRFNLEKIYDALFFIYSDSNKDNDTKNLAYFLISKIKSYKFVCSLVTWYNILLKINTVSKIMQKSTVILPEAAKMLEEVKKYLTECRTDLGYKEMLNESKIIAEELDCEISFPAVGTVRPRKRRPMFNYEGRDDATQNPELHFKVNFYFFLLDTAITKLVERFELLSDHNCFSFLHNLDAFKNLNSNDKLKYCADLQNKLTDFQTKHSDINAVDLLNEIEILPTYLKSTSSVIDVLGYLFKNNLISTFPNLSIALRIYLTLPVTVAEGERSFSKLKIIKNYLRSSMTQERLSNLAIISIENDVDIDINDIIKEFAIRKSRKIDFSF